ncbi:Aste57867_15542 [Aphanomyces stellatus]|uniref:Aste57867_15542 protein n=1 Tax=Aphanomyces stellatus TaxID=120398 RepID=A0A485L588_9STRA|nr:hypothetical protein As57867_015486 [Aphanomyces stellatus]VFT92344.1 Aste57867_15542 [Aphanomyces stellatus]
MRSCCPAWLAATAAVLALGASHVDATYTEEITLRPLPHVAKVAAHFNFELTTSSNTSSAFDVFPKGIRQVAQKYGVDDLHLTFTTGVWQPAQWGSPMGNGPHGVSLTATLHDPAEWRGLTQQLAGLFSASLNKMDSTVVYASPTSSSSSSILLHGMLPREELCTENLSPWLKLLPCRAHAGLGAWIRPLHVLDADFLSMGLRMTKETDGRLRLHQSLTVVRRVASPSWSLATLLGATSTTACPLAATSLVSTELPSLDSSAINVPSVLRIEPADTLHRHVASLSSATTTSAWLHQPMDAAPQLPYLGVVGHRYLTGHGQVQGGIGLRLVNTHPTKTVRVTYHETMPWYLRVYFNSFQLAVNGVPVDPLRLPSLAITPATLMGNPSQLAFQVDIAPEQDVVLAYVFDKAFLPMGLHPPDSNRGFDVPAASWTISDDDSTTTFFTEPLLVPLPTPDFSMPYNVIVLTSAVVAMSLGIVVNALLRHERKVSNLGWLVQKLRGLVPKKAAVEATKTKTE